MGHAQRGLRSELAHILSVDGYTLEELVDDAAAPVEAISSRLGRMIAHAVHHPVEARILHAFVPSLMQRVFGYSAGLGWLEALSRYAHRDRDALLSVVAPYGPVHSFCVRASASMLPDQPAAHPNSESHPQAQAHLPSLHLRFEFPVRNLPPATRASLRAITSSDSSDDGGSSSSSSPSYPSSASYLAPLLAPHVKRGDSGILLLDALTYFVLCMVASPAYKVHVSGVPDGMNPISRKRIRRSVSLPSTRALYNQLIAAYAASVCNGDPSSKVNPNDIFLPAVLDYLFLPAALACVSEDADVPQPSAAAADAVTAVLLTFLPSTPEALGDLHKLELRASKSAPISSLPLHSLSSMTYAQAVYSFIPYMLYGSFKHNTPTDEVAPSFFAHLRALTLFMAPWRGAVRSSIRALIFPRARSQSSTTDGGVTERARRAAFFVASRGVGPAHGSPKSGSTTEASSVPSLMLQPSQSPSSLRQHVASPQRSPHNATTAKESRWRAAFADRLARVDAPLFATAVVQATNIRAAVLPEGVRTLAVLADAAHAARPGTLLRSADHDSNGDDEIDGGGDGDGADGLKVRMQEIELCIDALRTQVSTAELKGVSKTERAFVSVLSSAAGVRLSQPGMLRNFTDMVQEGAQGVRGVVDLVAGSPNAGTEQSSKSRDGQGGGSGQKSKSSRRSRGSSGQRRSVLEKRTFVLSPARNRTGDKVGKSSPGSAIAMDVPFLGTVWDRPIESGEFGPFVIAAYWLALRLEPYIGFLPNTRFLGRFWLWFAVVTVVATITIFRSLLSTG